MNNNIDGRLRQALSEISGHSIGVDDYMAYFINEHGEELVFVRESGTRPGVLLHSDLDWEPRLVDGPPRIGAEVQDFSPAVRRFLGDVPVVGDVILNGPEALWLKGCLMASERW